MSSESLCQSVKLQIDALELRRDRPMVICDVDEVVVHFIKCLESHLSENDCWLDTSSFALNGNIRLSASNEAVPAHRVGELLYGCFDASTHAMDVIDGAADALHQIGRDTEIVMLTNLPERYLEQRSENLRGHGIPFPVVANTGHKGPAVEALIDGSTHEAVFIDDSPNNIASVHEWCPQARLIHFIQDDRFARHVESIDQVALRTDNWSDVHRFIAELVADARPQ